MNEEAQFFADQTGVFEIAQLTSNKGNKVMRQVSVATKHVYLSIGLHMTNAMIM